MQMALDEIKVHIELFTNQIQNDGLIEDEDFR
jgi:hypothetical protein